MNFVRDKFEQGNPFDNKGDDFEKNFKKLISGADAPAATPEHKEETKAIKPQPTKPAEGPASKTV